MDLHSGDSFMIADDLYPLFNCSLLANAEAVSRIIPFADPEGGPVAGRCRVCLCVADWTALPCIRLSHPGSLADCTYAIASSAAISSWRSAITSPVD